MIGKLIIFSGVGMLISATVMCSQMKTAADYFTQSIQSYKEAIDERRQECN